MYLTSSFQKSKRFLPDKSHFMASACDQYLISTAKVEVAATSVWNRHSKMIKLPIKPR